MSAASDEEALLARFRQWLSEVHAEAESADGQEELAGGRAEAPRVGLYRLAEEFTALRHEVKLQTRSVRNLEEQTAAAIAALDRAAAQFRAVEADEAAAAQRAATPLVETLVELDEALRRGRTMMHSARRRIAEESPLVLQRQLEELARRQPAWKRWLCRGWRREVVERAGEVGRSHREVLDALAEGYELIFGRLQKAMARECIERIECVGQPVDPRRMNVVEVIEDPSRAPGTVIEELRPGYLWKGKLFRFAEVRAVRAGSAPSVDEQSQ